MIRPRWSTVPAALVLSACATQAGGRSVELPTAETITFKVSEGTALGFDLSADGRTIVFDLLGQLWRLPGGGGVAVPITDAVRDTAEDLEPAISPDGRRIVFRGERNGRRGLWLLEGESSRPRQLTQLDDPDGHEGHAVWSPDGRTIAFARVLPPDSASRRPRSVVALLHPATGRIEQLRTEGIPGPNVSDPAWHPDGRRIAVVARYAAGPRGGRIWLVDAGGGEASALTDSLTSALAPVFSPDGARVAFFASDSAGRAQVWVRELTPSAERPRRITDHRDVTPTRIRWTPDGKRVVYGADGRLWAAAAAGGTPEEIRFSAEITIRRGVRSLPPARFPEPGREEPVRAFTGLSISPDGTRIGMIALGRLWVMRIGERPRPVGDVPISARYLTWSPDGAEVAWSAGPLEHEDMFATRVSTGATRRLTALPGREVFPAWSPDSRWIAFVHAGPGDAPRLRLIDAAAVGIADTSGTRSLGEAEAEWTGTAAFAPVWSPDGASLLAPSPNYDPTRHARATLVGLDGTRRETSLAASPIFAQWTSGALVYVRHARLWTVRFDSAGVHGAAEPLSADPALFPSVSSASDILYMSEGGLRLRSSTGEERRIGWPLSFTPPVPGPLLIRNARIVDGSGDRPTAPKDVLIERGRIARIDPAGESPPATGQTLDAAGRFLMPGLMDLHAHEYQPELLPGLLYFGVTTIRDQGAAIGPVVAFADAVAAGVFPGPRVSYGGFQFYTDWFFDAEDGHGIEPEADADHVRRAVALAQAFGAQHVKTRTFRRWDINARIVAEAHRRGLRVSGHCAHPLPLVAAGFDTKEHAGFCNARDDAPIYDDLIQLYRAAGISVVPTIVYTALAARLDRPDYFESDAEMTPFVPPITSDNWMLRLDAEGRRRATRVAEISRAATVKMVRAGVTIGLGTDVWQVPAAVHMELEELVQAGLTPAEAIRAATSNAARILGAEHDLGTVEVGKRADLVLVDADPTADIRNTRRISAVIQDGRVVDRAALRDRYAQPSR